ncbi:hypothetical protein F5X71_29590 [Nocardia brasiliensis]|uniref:Uncharacterized protein n=1 Tax=Nocardia brasiliensis TaxID=37326 RepID=A0A6G9XYH9_NOCBR|nr:hypothetical protein [Nocardia brasiliensis]QIS05907.1 hypothetical protein F5X71_29590 [Nocardia brasiliensis]
MNPMAREVSDPRPEAADGCDPNALLERFRAAVAVVSDTATEYYADENRSASETAKFYDEIAEYHREAAEAMELLDEHLSGGGRLPDAWRLG